MRDIECVICKSVFSSNHSQAKYCSDECRIVGKRQREKIWARKFRKEYPQAHLAAKKRQYKTMKKDSDKYELHLEKGRKWRHNNIERSREFSRKWIRKNKDWMIARNANARSNREDLDCEVVKGVFERDNFTCQYCGSQSELTMDHIVPIISGGTNDPKNLCVACRTCNCSKGAKTAEEFRQYLTEIK